MIKLDIKQYLGSFNILTINEIETFVGLLKTKTLKKDDFYIREGKVCNSLAFVTRGVFRSFYYSSTEEEVTYCFTFENNFVTAYSSFISQEKTAENIQALTDIEMLVINKEQINRLEDQGRNWLLLFKTLAEQEYIKMEKRIFLLQKEDAEIRYQNLLKNRPQYLQLIPLQYLASYLGITQRHLSRLRKSLSN